MRKFTEEEIKANEKYFAEAKRMISAGCKTIKFVDGDLNSFRSGWDSQWTEYGKIIKACKSYIKVTVGDCERRIAYNRISDYM